MMTIEATRSARTGVNRLHRERPDRWWKLMIAEDGERDAGAAMVRRRVRRIRRRSRPGDVVVLGEGGDPWSGGVAVRRSTRGSLKALLEVPGLSLCVLTRSRAVLEDLDLILAFDRASVGVLVPSVGPRMARRLEPASAGSRSRISLLRKLARMGVSAGLDLNPVFPGLGDRLGTLRRVAETAADAGAEWFRVQGVRLSPDGRVLDVLGGSYPGLARMYSLRFGPDGEPPHCWESRLQSMAASLRVETGLAAGPFADSASCDRSGQLRLPFERQAVPNSYALLGTT